MVRALASHQCGPSSNPDVNAICGLSLLLVLSFALRGFSPGTPVFPCPQKRTFLNSSSTHFVDVLSTNHSLFIYLFILVLMTKIHTIPLSVMKTSDYDTLTSGFVFFVLRRVNNNKLQCEYIPVSQ